MFVENMCRAGQMHRAGDWAGGWAAFRAGLQSYGEVALDVITQGAGDEIEAAVEVYDAVGSATESAEACADAEMRERFYMKAGRDSRPITPGAAVDSLAVWFERGSDGMGAVVADALFLEGSCGIVVEADSSWATADSTGLVYADVAAITDSLRFALVSPNVRDLHSPGGTNPESMSSFILRPTAADTLALGLLHCTSADTVAYYRWSDLAVVAGSRLELAVTRAQTVFLVRVDEENDGDFDRWVFADGTSTGIPDDASLPIEPLRVTARAAPNPTKGSTVFHVQSNRPLGDARIEVFDVSGRRIRSIFVGAQKAGVQAVLWDGRSDVGAPVASGIYFFRVSNDQNALYASKVLVLR